MEENGKNVDVEALILRVDQLQRGNSFSITSSVPYIFSLKP
jgi:hypothetical protein